jgi:16S rRNA processing protein RimM
VNEKEEPHSEELITIALIARPQGLRGEVIAELLTDFPERFAELDQLRIKRADGETLHARLEHTRIHKGRIVLKFSGCDDIDAAEKFRGARVLVTREELVELPADTYFEFDLIDCEVRTVEGRRVGRVAGVQNYGAAPLLSVRDEEQREYLIPLTLSICVEIDVAHKRIVIDPPEGLLEL